MYSYHVCLHHKHTTYLLWAWKASHYTLFKTKAQVWSHLVFLKNNYTRIFLQQNCYIDSYCKKTTIVGSHCLFLHGSIFIIGQSENKNRLVTTFFTTSFTSPYSELQTLTISLELATLWTTTQWHPWLCIICIPSGNLSCKSLYWNKVDCSPATQVNCCHRSAWA